MSELLIEMPSGVAGDMLLAALIDLGADVDAICAGLAGLGAGPIGIRVERVGPGGIVATRIEVEVSQAVSWQPVATEHAHPTILLPRHDHDHDHHHHDHDHDHHHHDPAQPSGHVHRPYRVIRELLEAADLPPRVRQRAQRAFRLLAEAEGRAHGVDPERVHFHEVGSLDAIADVVGVCLALEQLGIERVVAGPFTLGSGSVRCAHGRMPVPVPAVVHMLAASGAPQRRIDAETGELTTPTGCALVCALADSFAPSTVGALEAVGYGAGHKTIPGLVNLLRVCRCRPTATGTASDRVCELRCQMDDASGELLATVLEALLAAGARDAYLTPVLMKKGRPGHELTVLCDPDQRERLADWILIHTPTIGLRSTEQERRVLPRRSLTLEVHEQPIRLKVVTLPDGSERAKPEADDLAAAARTLDLPIERLRLDALRAWLDQR